MGKHPISVFICYNYKKNSRVSCQKGPTRHAYAWQIGPFWQDTFELTKLSHKMIQQLWRWNMACLTPMWSYMLLQDVNHINSTDTEQSHHNSLYFLQNIKYFLLNIQPIIHGDGEPWWYVCYKLQFALWPILVAAVLHVIWHRPISQIP